jgi:catechol 2,3-dioxygenase-like lactoylglutathione lyase family enzyme
MIRISLTSVMVDDQEKALRFYTEKLGFIKVLDLPAGEDRWLTVASPDDVGGVQLVLEPNRHPAAKVYQAALYADGIPATAFAVDDLEAEHRRLAALGVAFSVPPTEAGGTRIAVLDDTCGNLIQLFQVQA